MYERVSVVHYHCFLFTEVFFLYLQVNSFRLADTEKDYTLINKQYPKLFISPEFTKVFVCLFLSLFESLIFKYCHGIVSFRLFLNGLLKI